MTGLVLGMTVLVTEADPRRALVFRRRDHDLRDTLVRDQRPLHLVWSRRRVGGTDPMRARARHLRPPLIGLDDHVAVGHFSDRADAVTLTARQMNLDL